MIKIILLVLSLAAVGYTEKIITAVGCEYGTSKVVTLKCAKNRQIQIVRAMYGREKANTCMRIPMKTLNCGKGATAQTIIAKKKCEGKNTCTLTATNKQFKDNCVGTTKYLEVTYRCIPIPEMKSSVGCEYGPNKVVTLRCKNTERINIVRAMYGREKATTCMRIPMKTTSCGKGASVQTFKAKMKCNNQVVCTLTASNGEFGDNCPGTTKYLEVSYQCIPVTSLSAVACEGKNVRVGCKKDERIKVERAMYGRETTSICPYSRPPTTNCGNGWLTQTAIAQKECEGKEQCNLPASNGKFGDMCRGTRKYLQVSFKCVKKELKAAIVCENGSKNLQCSPGKKLRIDYAVYGRHSKNICKSGPRRSTKCGNYLKSLGIVRKACDNKPSCRLAAKNTIFGDPCYGTYKYLQVNYECM